MAFLGLRPESEDEDGKAILPLSSPRGAGPILAGEGAGEGAAAF